MTLSQVQSSSRGVTARATRLMVTLMVCAGGLASAHKVKCFAAADGDVVTGYAWFAGGTRPRDVPFRVYDPDGRLLCEGTTNPRGEFSFAPVRLCDHRVEVEASPGHVAQFLVRAADLPAGLAGTETSSAPAAPEAETKRTDGMDPVAARDVTETSADHRDLPVLISRAVSREIAPLRRELAEFKDKQRWQDIIAGVGYLVGVAGIASFFLSRRRASPSC
ncbi:MAG: hypothetical protein RRC34_00960 [Lentisphaeria bacterium]|nr:hypothetical protein [Lentisphaeria bacterium]